MLILFIASISIVYITISIIISIYNIHCANINTLHSTLYNYSNYNQLTCSFHQLNLKIINSFAVAVLFYCCVSASLLVVSFWLVVILFVAYSTTPAVQLHPRRF